MGGFNTLVSSLISQSELVLTENRNPQEICKLIEKFKVSVLSTTPTFLNLMLGSGLHKAFNLNSLKKVTYGTEVMNEAVLIKLVKIFPKVKFKQTYGLTEIGVIPTKSEAKDSLFFKISSDKVRTRIIKDVLYIKCESEMKGVVKFINGKNPKIENHVSEWFCTDDKVVKKGEYIKILGRNTDIINVGGEKIYPIEVEAALYKLDYVNSAVAFKKPHRLLGNIVAVRVVLKQNRARFSVSDTEMKKKIQKDCKKFLSKFAIPSIIEIVDEIPVSNRLKTLRN